jgi:hypothetical protein
MDRRSVADLVLTIQNAFGTLAQEYPETRPMENHDHVLRYHKPVTGYLEHLLGSPSDELFWLG